MTNEDAIDARAMTALDHCAPGEQCAVRQLGMDILELEAELAPFRARPTTLTVYAIRNADGEFFRAKGYGVDGSTWVAEPAKAKLYTLLSQARSRVSYFAIHYPALPPPVLIAFSATASETSVLDETARVAKVQERARTKEARDRQAAAKRDLKDAEYRLALARADLERAKGRVSA